MGDDEGSVLLLGIGWLAACLLAMVVMIDVSAAFLQRQHLQALADSAALAGAQGIDLASYYEHGASASTRLDGGAVAYRVSEHVRRALEGGQAGGTAERPTARLIEASTDGDTVLVGLTAPIALPILPGAISIVLPEIVVTSTARLAYRG